MISILRLSVLPALIVVVLFAALIEGKRDQNLHVVFCDVGQGDGIYIRFPDGQDMIVDSGYGNAMLNCLGEHMPFWDRTIDIAVVTHPQQDHYGGMIEILNRYTVGSFITPSIASNDDSYSQLIGLLDKNDIQVSTIYTGDMIILNKYTKLLNNNIKKVHEAMGDTPIISVLWPQKHWVISHSQYDSSSANELLDRVPQTNTDPNDFSYVVLISWLQFDVLLTGDAEVAIVQEAVEEYFDTYPNNADAIEVLKVPHHGSEHAVNTGFLSTINSSVGVLSMGKNNRYGHPHRDVIAALDEAGVSIKRTDVDGSIEIISDGKGWWVEE